MFDNGINNKLGRFKWMRSDERMQFYIGVFKFDQSQT